MSTTGTKCFCQRSSANRNWVRKWYFGADAGFVKPEIYEALEGRSVKYAIRIPANDSLERDIAELLTRLSCHRFCSNQVRLGLSVLAYSLDNLWRRLALPKRIENWSLTSLQQRPVKTGGRLVKHARYYWLFLAEGHLNRQRSNARPDRAAASTYRIADAGQIPMGIGLQPVEGRRGVARVGQNMGQFALSLFGLQAVGSAPGKNCFTTSRVSETGVESLSFLKSKRRFRLE